MKTGSWGAGSMCAGFGWAYWRLRRTLRRFGGCEEVEGSECGRFLLLGSAMLRERERWREEGVMMFAGRECGDVRKGSELKMKDGSSRSRKRKAPPNAKFEKLRA